MATVFVDNRRIRLGANMVIGKGGEADIFKVSDFTALKLFKQPTDLNYTGNSAAQQGALDRIAEHQRKLPAFPKGLPVEVVAPANIALDAPGGRIIGYTMPLIDNMDVLMNLGNKAYRDTNGISNNRVVELFRELRRVVAEMHKLDVVIGDFNDLNVLTDAKGIRLVDADSMQFGAFMCHTFTTRFVDPMNSDRAALSLIRPHNQLSDWYAYFVMLLQSLLYVGPYGGVHRPKNGKRLQHDERVLKRVTLLGNDVVYPKPAAPLSSLPDTLLDYMQSVFEQDKREPFPVEILDKLRWTICTSCGLAHSRQICPSCSAPGMVMQTVTIRGHVTARRIFKTNGVLLQTVNHDGVLRYLYQEGSSLYREDGQKINGITLRPEFRFRIKGESTAIGFKDKLMVVSQNGGVESLSAEQYRATFTVFDTNQQDIFWVQNGQLLQTGRLGPQYLGDVLTNQTLFWVGQNLGFGLYQAGQLVRSFVFKPGKRGLNDQVAINQLPGQTVDAACVFGNDRAWFMTSAQENGVLINRCYVIDVKGHVLAAATALQGEDSWLGQSIRGHFSSGNSLFAATDEGIVRVGVDAGQLAIERSFPDTEPFVDSHTHLISGPGGIYAVSNKEITLLEIR